MLEIPAPDASFDFLYIINVLHHLASIDEQRRAFAELLRVLKPGGLLFVHEINTRNVLFRFYMGYVFPSLNCIDEGVERWLLPHRLAQYTEAPRRRRPLLHVPAGFRARGRSSALLRPLERLLEASPLRVYSAHYMAVLEKERPRVIDDAATQSAARRGVACVRLAQRSAGRCAVWLHARLHSHRQMAGERSGASRAARAGLAARWRSLRPRLHRVRGALRSARRPAGRGSSARSPRPLLAAVALGRSVSAVAAGSAAAAARARRSAPVGRLPAVAIVVVLLAHDASAGVGSRRFSASIAGAPCSW